MRCPGQVYRYLRSGFVQPEAHDLLQSLQRAGDYQPGGVVHPGDPFGAVLAWLWRDEPAEAIGLLADFIAQLRKWDELATLRQGVLTGGDVAEPPLTPEMNRLQAGLVGEMRARGWSWTRIGDTLGPCHGFA